jgi:hypothetical protein
MNISRQSIYRIKADVGVWGIVADQLPDYLIPTSWYK